MQGLQGRGDDERGQPPRLLVRTESAGPAGVAVGWLQWPRVPGPRERVARGGHTQGVDEAGGQPTADAAKVCLPRATGSRRPSAD
eukprot:1110937-Lingulodinium_polyedra.AAC.1